jgi:hypothetical protein
MSVSRHQPPFSRPIIGVDIDQGHGRPSVADETSGWAGGEHGNSSNRLGFRFKEWFLTSYTPVAVLVYLRSTGTGSKLDANFLKED